MARLAGVRRPIPSVRRPFTAVRDLTFNGGAKPHSLLVVARAASAIGRAAVCARVPIGGSRMSGGGGRTRQDRSRTYRVRSRSPDVRSRAPGVCRRAPGVCARFTWCARSPHPAFAIASLGVCGCLCIVRARAIRARTRLSAVHDRMVDASHTTPRGEQSHVRRWRSPACRWKSRERRHRSARRRARSNARDQRSARRRVE